MSNKKHEVLIMIGRFQIFHNGHMATLLEALTIADKVIIVLGSSRSSRSLKNPFSDEERISMITSSLDPDSASRVFFVAVKDYLYANNRWLESVQEEVNEVVSLLEVKNPKLIGHLKEDTGYLLEFPQWGPHVEVGSLAGDINASLLRSMYFNENTLSKMRETTVYSRVPTGTEAFLREFAFSEEYYLLLEEDSFIREYKEAWAGSPHTPIFVTTDAVVIKNGHVLLIERGGFPGKGLYALPGGFIDPNETLYSCVLRELREETRLKVPLPVLDHANKGDSKVFDSPGRSSRGRTITHAFLFRLDGSDLTPGLPKVKGSDDAKKAFWVPFSALPELSHKFYEDHLHIINYFL